MKKNELKALPADAVLDAELAQMAEEVPPMPADFHARWVNAVRAEAAKAVPETEEKTQKNPVSIVRWTRILSVAAVFMFLIGGTILYRNAGKTLTSPIVAQEKKAAEQDAGAVAAEEPEVLYMNAEEPAAVGAAGAAEETEDAAVPEMHILMAEAYEEAPQADAEAPMMDAEAMVTDAVEEDASAEAAYENYGEARTNKAAEGGALMMNAAEKASGAAASATAAGGEERFPAKRGGVLHGHGRLPAGGPAVPGSAGGAGRNRAGDPAAEKARINPNDMIQEDCRSWKIKNCISKRSGRASG